MYQLQWFGGHKGFGIGMLVEIMSGLLANSCFGFQEHTESDVHGKERVAKGATFVVLDVERFMPLDEFRRRSDQLIDDVQGKTVASASTRDKDVRSQLAEGHGGNCAAAVTVGKAIAERAKALGIQAVCFDRGHYKYHGRLAALADALRECGVNV